MGRLPEQTQANLQMVGGLRQQQDSTAMSLRSEQDRLAMIERQIEAMRQGASDAPLSKARRPSAQERLMSLAPQLDEASAMYTEKHPEIQRLKVEIAPPPRRWRSGERAPRGRARAGSQRRPGVSSAARRARDRSKLRIREHERAAARAQGRDRAVPEPRRSGADDRAAAELAEPRVRPREAAIHQPGRAAPVRALAEDLERRRAGEQFAVLYPAGLPSQPELARRAARAAPRDRSAAWSPAACWRSAASTWTLGLRRARPAVEFELPVLAEIRASPVVDRERDDR